MKISPTIEPHRRTRRRLAVSEAPHIQTRFFAVSHLDGEAVVLGVDGVADFNALHSRKHDHEVQLYLRYHCARRR